MSWISRIIDQFEERRATRAYQRMLDRGQRQWLASERYAQIKACKHESRRRNPKATANASIGWNPQICNDCGIGLMTIPPRRG